MPMVFVNRCLTSCVVRSRSFLNNQPIYNFINFYVGQRRSFIIVELFDYILDNRLLLVLKFDDRLLLVLNFVSIVF